LLFIGGLQCDITISSRGIPTAQKSLLVVATTDGTKYATRFDTTILYPRAVRSGNFHSPASQPIVRPTTCSSSPRAPSPQSSLVTSLLHRLNLHPPLPSDSSAQSTSSRSPPSSQSTATKVNGATLDARRPGPPHQAEDMGRPVFIAPLSTLGGRSVWWAGTECRILQLQWQRRRVWRGGRDTRRAGDEYAVHPYEAAVMGWIRVLPPVEKLLACGDLGVGGMMKMANVVGSVVGELGLDSP